VESSRNGKEIVWSFLLGGYGFEDKPEACKRLAGG